LEGFIRYFNGNDKIHRKAHRRFIAKLAGVAGSDPRIPGCPHTTLFFVRGSKSSENHESCEHSRFFGLPVAFTKEVWHSPVGKPMEGFMGEKPDVLQGTLALMVLKTLDVLGPLHGYGIARRIERISGDLLAVNQGTLYPLLLRLEQEGAIASEWGASENNRRARFYHLTRAGRKLLESETRDWEQTAAIIARFFEVKAEDLS
jgi:PadR family transcriptional regulator, regulatory protein PadR